MSHFKFSCFTFQCMAPALLPLLCSNGECGHVMTPLSSTTTGGTTIDQCTPECSVHEQCSAALASPGCGWCAFGSLNGLGVSMEGGLMGPLHGTCDHSGVFLNSRPLPGMFVAQILLRVFELWFR